MNPAQTAANLRKRRKAAKAKAEAATAPGPPAAAPTPAPSPAGGGGGDDDLDDLLDAAFDETHGSAPAPAPAPAPAADVGTSRLDKIRSLAVEGADEAAAAQGLAPMASVSRAAAAPAPKPQQVNTAAASRENRRRAKARAEAQAEPDKAAPAAAAAADPDALPPPPPPKPKSEVAVRAHRASWVAAAEKVTLVAALTAAGVVVGCVLELAPLAPSADDPAAVFAATFGGGGGGGALPAAAEGPLAGLYRRWPVGGGQADGAPPPLVAVVALVVLAVRGLFYVLRFAAEGWLTTPALKAAAAKAKQPRTGVFGRLRDAWDLVVLCREGLRAYALLVGTALLTCAAREVLAMNGAASGGVSSAGVAEEL